MQTLLNNRYQVIRTLGSGGFGETFLAEDTQMPSHRRCVIKQLKPIQNNPQIYQLVQERFQREAAILEDLDQGSDQIPSLYAYFQSEGKFYVVQEWIDGDTLAAKIEQQGILSESTVREILVSLLPVLDYVHSKRIIHRDIKPDNIILRHRDGKPVLIDFGAVRESMGTVVNSQGNPTSSIVIGTPGYMSSEQAAGRPVYSSDLYSLGMTAIYLLTGKQPQEMETDPRTGEIIWKQYASHISPIFKTVIDQAIAYHPRDRYPTAKDMLAALQTGAVTFPASTSRVSPSASPQPVNPTNPRKNIFVGSLIGGGLVFIAGMIGFAINNNQQSVVPSPPLPTTAVADNSDNSSSANTTPEPSLLNPSPTENPPDPPTSTPVGRPYLGVRMVTMTPEIRDKINSEFNLNLTADSGVLLVEIVPNSPASSGGLRVGDVVRSINNQTVNTVEELQKLVANSRINIPLPITVERNGETIQITVVPSEQPTQPQTNKQIEQPSSPEATRSRVAPETAIQNYYDYLNRGEYQTAWNQLSLQHQSNTESHPNGFSSFTEWWEQVTDINFQNFTNSQENNKTAIVEAQLSYTIKTTGQRISGTRRFSLIWDSSSQRWLIDKIERV
ncbi:protein kinase domain-containing protein [Calothrix sp. NIES-3974]|uniref:protein kinase domain-containing protein n=1 Tax=Calothrix sp. NIES-3974 TaxID=2005462 RepID=UPI000B614E47|nr:protein kinase [Calothrix sp. NIES-3974]BAZ05678.1 serine/threonine kinase [Calothrix sp. NIES-3974]